MIRHATLISLILLGALAAGAQHRGLYEKWIATGDRYFQQEQYSLAIQFYKDANDLNISDAATDYKLAECYRHIFDYPEAETYYLKVFYADHAAFPLSLYYYALMLKLNGNLSEAAARFSEFTSYHESNAALKNFAEQAVVEMSGCSIARADMDLPRGQDPQILPPPVNTPYNDYAPAFRDEETLVITSSRVASNRTLIDERYGEAFTDNYFFKRSAQRWEDRTKQFFAITNSRYNDGSGSFSKRGDEYYFSVCETRCQVYVVREENNKWTIPAKLGEHVNYPDADTKQPALSHGGDTLFFVSNRPGGFGQADIWFSVKSSDGAWGPSVNAGKSINTRANELSPTTTGSPGILFFASDGHPGYGGFDLFMAKKGMRRDTVLYNLGLPFNSVRDDVFLTIYGKQVLWSSNRAGGYGGLDIYANTSLSESGLIARLSARNRNDSRTVSLTSRTARAENMQLLASRNEETIDYNNLTYEKKLVVNKMVENRLKNRSTSKEQFAGLDQAEYESLEQISEMRFQSLLLKQRYTSLPVAAIRNLTGITGQLYVTGQLSDSVSGRPLVNERVFLVNEYGDILKITSTNESGMFRFTAVKGEDRFFLRVAAAPGQTTSARATNISLRASGMEHLRYMENVYFDFDHYAIRPEAAQVLSQLAEYLRANPGAQVEIYSFADDRGSYAYNFELTQKRGQAIVSFLARYGVDETSLAIVPKGRQPVSQSFGEIQRQYNRRAEFYINGISQAVESQVKTYIIRKESAWSLIAKVTGVSLEALKILNGADGNPVKAFQPIRLPIEVTDIPSEMFFVGI